MGGGILSSAGRDWCLSALAVAGVAAPFSLFGLKRFHGLGERNHPVRKGRKMMPTSSKPDTSAIHRVLIDSGADPKLIHPAIEEIRHLSGQNVTTAIGAQITELRSDVQTQITELRSDVQTQITELRSDVQTQITELRSEMQAQINGLQAQITELRSEMRAQIKGLQAQFTALRAEMNTLTKIIWTLVSLLFIPMFGLLYKILTS